VIVVNFDDATSLTGYRAFLMDECGLSVAQANLVLFDYERCKLLVMFDGDLADASDPRLPPDIREAMDRAESVAVADEFNLLMDELTKETPVR